MCACQQMSSMDGEKPVANLNDVTGLNGQVKRTSTEAQPTTTNSQPEKKPTMERISDWVSTATELFKTTQSAGSTAPEPASKVSDSVWIAGGLVLVLVAAYFLFGRKG